MAESKKFAGVAAAICIVTVIGGFVLPVPHMYQPLYVYIYGPLGALAGYGIARVISERSVRPHPVVLIVVGLAALISAVVCASVYWQLYNLERSPSIEARTVHATLYASSFAFFFFLARWAIFMFKANKNEMVDGDKNASEDINRSPQDPKAEIKKNLILFIHGLGGDKVTTWGRFPDILRQDQLIAKDYQLEYFSYPTMLWRHYFSPKAPRIQELAAGLRTQIENRYASAANVFLVCHSLGGLVGRQYVLENVKQKRRLRVRGLFLIAVPNNGADLAKIGAFLSVWHPQMRQLCRDSDLIEILNNDWVNMNLNAIVRSKYIVGTQDRVVDRLSAQVHWGNQNVETVIGKNHRDIVKPTNPGDDIVIILKRFLQEDAQLDKDRVADGGNDQPAVRIEGPAVGPAGKEDLLHRN